MKVDACILIRVSPGKASEALKAVKKLPEVKKSFFVFGRCDIVAFVEAPTYEAISTLTTNINAIKELKSTKTLVEA